MIHDWNLHSGNGGESPARIPASGGFAATASRAFSGSPPPRSLVAGDPGAAGLSASAAPGQEQRQLLRMIRDLLQSRYGMEFAVYKDEDQLELYWSLLEQDLAEDSEQLQVLARVYETMESRSIKRESAEIRIYPSLDNHLFCYPEWKVALVRLPMPRVIGRSLEPYLFAESDESLRRFLAHARERLRSRMTGKLLLCCDGDEGTIAELAPHRMERWEPVQDLLRMELERSVSAFFQSGGAFYEQFGLNYRRGVLLYGKPGNGKTSLVRALASKAGVPAMSWQLSEHTSTESIREMLRRAEEMAPMLLIVEDLEGLRPELRSVFLGELDGMRTREGIYLIATTNYPDLVDPALIGRPGRIDRAYEVAEPSRECRDEFLRRKSRGLLFGAKQLEELADRTKGFSYAQLEELVAAAAFDWQEKGQVETEPLLRAIRQEMEHAKDGSWLSASGSGKVGFFA
ncbi:AAA family ATPase [Paenibacillus albicereus]|uniref:AAA family ATPase n=1 Tax=Paenibacillus albicereus TaxID=2726185 RepID=A0A6H2H1A5_9BACL|nr:AAA family ATPase [Paenibacillus albicereus]QJC53471.1 AAA family ATPase [Paenibacillus albicereus]